MLSTVLLCLLDLLTLAGVRRHLGDSVLALEGTSVPFRSLTPFVVVTQFLDGPFCPSPSPFSLFFRLGSFCASSSSVIPSSFVCSPSKGISRFFVYILFQSFRISTLLPMCSSMLSPLSIKTLSLLTQVFKTRGPTTPAFLLVLALVWSPDTVLRLSAHRVISVAGRHDAQVKCAR